MCDVAESIIQINCFRKEGIKLYELFEEIKGKTHLKNEKKIVKIPTENNDL